MLQYDSSELDRLINDAYDDGTINYPELYEEPFLDDIEEGSEKGMPGIFYKRSNMFKLGELNGSKIMKLSDGLQLPNASVLHLLDNFARTPLNPNEPVVGEDFYESIDTPAMEKTLLIANEENRKFIYHTGSLDLSGPFTIDDKYIFLTAGMSRNFMKFKSIYKMRYRAVPEVSAFPKMNMSLALVNHNPTFRVIVRGVMSTMRKFNIIFSSIMNTIVKVPNDRVQYLLIPLKPTNYRFSDFFRSMNDIQQRTLKYPFNFQYLFFVHFFNFLNPDAKASMFYQLPEEKYKTTTFVFQCGEYALFSTVEDMLKLCRTPGLFRKFMNLINNLMTLGTTNKSSSVDVLELNIPKETPTGLILPNAVEAEELAQEKTQPLEQDETISDPTVGEQVLTDVRDKATVDGKTEIVEAIDDAVTTVEVDAHHPEVKTVTKSPLRPAQAFKESADIELDDESPEEVVSDEPTATATEYETAELKKIHAVVTTIGDNPSLDIEDVGIKKTFTATDIADIGKSYIGELDAAAKEIIEQAVNITPNRRNRIRNISQRYKSLTLDGKSIEHILKEPIDPALDIAQTTDVVANDIVDKSMLKSSIVSMDELYLKRFLNRDIVSVLTSFNKSGMFLVDLETKDRFYDATRFRTYKCKYEDISGKVHTVLFDLSVIDKDGNCYIDGTKYYFRKQIIALPICKLSKTKVSLASNHNKTVVERNVTKAHNFVDYIQRIINAINSAHDDPVITVAHKSGIVEGRKLPYEYTSMASRYEQITFANAKSPAYYVLFFDPNIADKFLQKHPEYAEFKQHGTFFGYNEKASAKFCLYMDINNFIYVIDMSSKKVLHKTSLIDFIFWLYQESSDLDIAMPPLTEWVDLKILDKKLPIGFVLSYKYGLRNLLDDLKLPYMLVPKRGNYRKQLLKSDIVIPFKDRNLVFSRYPIKNSLIVSGLKFFDTSAIDFEDMDISDTYFTLLNMKGISIHYLKGIDSTFELFVDPITREVLLQMEEPTTFKGLLIRATEMVSTDFHKDATSAAHHRVRSYERLATILYNELSTTFANYVNKSGASSTFSLEPKAVINRIMQDQAMMVVEDINPVHELKTKTSMTFAGFGGRQSESFVASDRRFTDDAVGIVSESTVDSGTVGVVVGASMNPKINGVRGLVLPDASEEVSPTNMLSVTSLLMPATTHDDGKRTNFTNIQLTHHVPVENSSTGRVRTGYERVIPHILSDSYAHAAEQDGKVIDADDKLKLLKIKYKDGTETVLKYGETYTYTSTMYVTQDIRAAVRVGDVFKKGDILIYNAGFFQPDPYSKQVDWKHGTYANVAVMDIDGTFEDSSVLTRKFADNLAMSPTYERLITFQKDSVVVNAVREGDKVSVNDYLIVLEDADVASFTIAEDMAEDARDYLIGLNRLAPRAKFAGEIVEMDAFYGCPVNEMHPSIQRLIKPIIDKRKKAAQFGKGTVNASEFTEPTPLPKMTKYKKQVEFDGDTVVIKYLIKSHQSMNVGDKHVICNSLKTIVAEVIDDIPMTESGKEIDIMFAGSGISNRIVLSPMLTGLSEMCMEQLQTDAVTIYKKGKK